MVILNSTAGDIAEIEGIKYRFEINNTGEFIIFKDNNPVARVALQEMLKQGRRSNLNRDEMKIVLENENISLALYFFHINGERKEEGIYDIQSINAKLLFSLR